MTIQNRLKWRTWSEGVWEQCADKNVWPKRDGETRRWRELHCTVRSFVVCTPQRSLFGSSIQALRVTSIRQTLCCSPMEILYRTVLCLLEAWTAFQDIIEAQRVWFQKHKRVKAPKRLVWQGVYKPTFLLQSALLIIWSCSPLCRSHNSHREIYRYRLTQRCLAVPVFSQIPLDSSVIP